MYNPTALTKTKYPIQTTAKQTLITCICLACIFLFTYTAYAKIVDHERFLKGLSKVQRLENYAIYISWLAPIMELLISLLLIIPKTQILGLKIFTAIMGIFTLYITVMLLWAEKLPCNCGGAIEKLSWTQHLWFNLGFIVLSSLAIWLSKENKISKLKSKRT